MEVATTENPESVLSGFVFFNPLYFQYITFSKVIIR